LLPLVLHHTVRAEELKDISHLASQGQDAQALEKVNDTTSHIPEMRRGGF
jgi:hypothetical protein